MYNSVISTRTRSRSNSVSSIDFSVAEEAQVFAPNSPPVSQETGNFINADITTSLTKSLQVVGATNTWNTTKFDVKKILRTVSQNEQRISKCEEVLAKNTETLARIECILKTVLDKFDSYSVPENGEVDSSFEAGSAFHNQVSGMIRASLENQKEQSVQWDFEKGIRDSCNEIVISNVIDYVGDQIRTITNKPWEKSIKRKDLREKIALVYRRNKAQSKMTPAQKAASQKANVRKNRRVTKCKHRKEVLSHEVYGPLIRNLFGNDVENLALEQLQSDEESTDSEMGEVDKSTTFKVIRPSWRSEKGIEAFKKFDEFDLAIRKSARKDKESRTVGRFKPVNVKEEYLNKAPLWSRH